MKIPGPVFIIGNRHGCRHSLEDYVGSFATKSDRFLDTYYLYDVFYIKKDDGVCLRYGDEQNEYISPGGLENLKKSTNNTYITSYQMIMEKLNATKT